MRLSGSPRILSSPNGSLGDSANVRIWDDTAAAARRLPMMVVALSRKVYFFVSHTKEMVRFRSILENEIICDSRFRWYPENDFGFPTLPD